MGKQSAAISVTLEKDLPKVLFLPLTKRVQASVTPPHLPPV